MNNADMPAMPSGKIKINPPKGGDPLGNYTTEANGLTKREYFAGLAMQALISNGDNHSEYTASTTAFSAIELADELLKQLEEK